MEVSTFALHREKRQGEAGTQLTFDEDYNLPDYKPDFAGYLTAYGQVRIEEVKVTKGHVSIRGNLRFEILYRTEDVQNGMSSMEGSLPFQETLSVDAATEFDSADASGSLEDLSVTILNSRKLSIRALVDLSVVVSSFVTELLPQAQKETDRMPVKNTEVSYLELKAQGQEHCRIREQIQLPGHKANIQNLIWKQLQMQGLQVRAERGRIVVKGELLLFLLYRGDTEERLEWVEETVPFQCTLDSMDGEADDISFANVQLMDWNIQPAEDEQGEARELAIDALLKVSYRLYTQLQQEMLSDVYALDCSMQPEYATRFIPRLLAKNESRCKVTETIALEEGKLDVLQICSCFGGVQIDSQQIVEDGIEITGAVQAKILYLTRDDKIPMDAHEVMLPFSYRIEIPGMKKDCTYQWYVCPGTISVSMKSEKSLEVTAILEFQVLAYQEQECAIIESVTEEPLDLDALQKLPGLIGIRVAKGDSLWNIARDHHTTIAEIRKTNPDVPLDTLTEGTTVLLLKRM